MLNLNTPPIRSGKLSDAELDARLADLKARRLERERNPVVVEMRTHLPIVMADGGNDPGPLHVPRAGIRQPLPGSVAQIHRVIFGGTVVLIAAIALVGLSVWLWR